MTTADHLARAGHLLDGVHAESVLDAAALSLAHSVHAWVLWETGWGVKGVEQGEDA